MICRDLTNSWIEAYTHKDETYIDCFFAAPVFFITHE